MMARFNFKGIGTSNISIVYFPKILDIDTLIKFLSIYLNVAISLLAYILDIDTLIKFLFIYLSNHECISNRSLLKEAVIRNSL